MFGLVPFRSNGVKSTGNSFDDFFSSFFNDDFFSPVNMGGNFKADIKETANEYIMEAELPGVKKEDINLEYKDNNLVVSGKRDEILEESKDNYIRKERHYGQFVRSFYINNVDKDNISATFENGVLHVNMPKVENVINNSNRIEIK
ncbi:MULTISPECIES: Hsp20/alpha crystallin family protein [Clostridium]|uniref:Hsp20/alpha crystallin family protein n=1 Tax=Clostridium cibarium TaxID=2762247 RepID=A0ABR8PTN0_9CLOT|nr:MULTISPECIES: Hsp20/alpha crystallin family protein [Clostridium]MBD7911532.1 Hsp20/alpha crystallin family protein [Clostridium cibarium]